MGRPKKLHGNPTINEIARPEFKGDKERLIQIVEQLASPIKDPKIIPPCFSDPNLESGVCNPQLPLRENELAECVFAKSCLVAKLLSCSIPIQAVKCAKKSYAEVLAESDELFERQQTLNPPDMVTNEADDRQKLRGHGASIPLQPPVNPFRKNSLRRLVLDVMTRNWVSLGDLKATLFSLVPDATRIDQAIAQVFFVGTQEANNYRVVEAFGKYKAFRRI